MARPKALTNKSILPDDQIEMLAKAFMKSIYDYWDSEEGQKAYAEYLSNKNENTIISVKPMPEQVNTNK
ncbi:MAG: hypothetical protein IJJ61_10000 [Clostridia bacterium]|nr:hypothetical protein [Clostridia bacterium]